MSIQLGPHLHASIHNFTGYGLGNCFQRSVAMVMDRPTARLVIGTLTSHDDGHSYIHCWVEEGAVDYDPTRFEDHDGEVVALERDIFRASSSARDVHVVPRSFIKKFATEGKLSKWMLTTDDTHHTLGGVMGEVLLQRLGIPFRVDVGGGILPV